MAIWHGLAALLLLVLIPGAYAQQGGGRFPFTHAHGGGGVPPVGDSLILYMLFNNSLTDIEGNFTFSTNGSPVYETTSPTPHEGTHSLFFDYDDDCIYSAQNPDLSGGFTIKFAGWSENYTYSGAQVLMSTSRGSGSGHGGWAIWRNQYDGNDRSIRFYNWDASYNQNACYSNTSVWSTSSWNTIVITWDGSTTIKFYVNGSDVTNAGTCQDDFTASGVPLYIGNYDSYAYGGDFNIDELKIFDMELTGTALTALLAE
jgi:hypothetical protein